MQIFSGGGGCVSWGVLAWVDVLPGIFRMILGLGLTVAPELFCSCEELVLCLCGDARWSVSSAGRVEGSWAGAWLGFEVP